MYRLDEAIELVKALASKHGAMKQATLNSLIRSLADVAQVARALRLLSIMLNMSLKPYRSTLIALIAACARDSNSLEASRLYWCASILFSLACFGRSCGLMCHSTLTESLC